MLLCLWVAILLCHAEVDDMNDAQRLAARPPNQEIIRLDIAVNQILLVDCLYSGKHLLRDHDHSLCGEFAAAMVEEIFQGRAQQIYDQNVVETFLTKVVDVWNAS